MIQQLPLFTPTLPTAPPALSFAALEIWASALGYALDGPTDIGLYRLNPFRPVESHVAADSPYSFLRGSLREVSDLLAAIADGRQCRTSAEMGARLWAAEEMR